jgi:hypothetical protein
MQYIVNQSNLLLGEKSTSFLYFEYTQSHQKKGLFIHLSSIQVQSIYKARRVIVWYKEENKFLNPNQILRLQLYVL